MVIVRAIYEGVVDGWVSPSPVALCQIQLFVNWKKDAQIGKRMNLQAELKFWRCGSSFFFVMFLSR